MDNNRYNDDEDINLLDYVKIIFAYKYILLLFIIIGIAVGFVYIQRQPVYYKTELSFFLPSQGASNTSAASGYLSLLGMGGSASSGLSDQIFMLTSSKRMKKKIIADINNFGLPDRDLELYLLTLNPGANGTYILSFKSKNPDLLLPVLHSCLKNLDELNMELNLTAQKNLVTILDDAEKPSGPDASSKLKTLIIIISASGFAGIFFIFVLNYLRTLK